MPAGYQAVRDEDTGLRTGAKCFSRQAETKKEQAFLDELSAIGLQACFTTKFRKKTRDATRDLISIALLAPNANAASKMLPVVKKATGETLTGFPEARDVPPPPKLGEESLPGVRATEAPLEFVMYSWRVRNAAAFLMSLHLTPEMSHGDVLKIAEKVDFRAGR